MKKIEKLGVQLAMLIRRKDAALAELDYVEKAISKLRRELIEMPVDALYKDTAELAQVGDERPTVTFQAIPHEEMYGPCPGPQTCPSQRPHVHRLDGAYAEY